MSADMITDMLDAMRSAGIGPVKDLAMVADGKVHRYRVEGDKAGSSNGWYVLFDGATQGGTFRQLENWRDAHLARTHRQAANGG